MRKNTQYEFRSFEVDSSAFELAVKPTALRLGNWLQSYIIFNNGFGDISKKCISSFKVDLKTLEMLSSSQALLVTVEPIQLTPEILLKAGMTKIKDGCMSPDIYEKKYTKRIVANTFIFHFDGKDGYWMEGNTIVEVNCLHELQNLYSALTGTELEIKL